MSSVGLDPILELRLPLVFEYLGHGPLTLKVHGSLTHLFILHILSGLLWYFVGDTLLVFSGQGPLKAIWHFLDPFLTLLMQPIIWQTRISSPLSWSARPTCCRCWGHCPSYWAVNTWRGPRHPRRLLQGPGRGRAPLQSRTAAMAQESRQRRARRVILMVAHCEVWIFFRLLLIYSWV